MHAGAIDDLATNLVAKMKVELGNSGLIAGERAVKRPRPKKFRMTQEPLLIGGSGCLSTHQILQLAPARQSSTPFLQPNSPDASHNSRDASPEPTYFGGALKPLANATETPCDYNRTLHYRSRHSILERTLPPLPPINDAFKGDLNSSIFRSARPRQQLHQMP